MKPFNHGFPLSLLIIFVVIRLNIRCSISWYVIGNHNQRGNELQDLLAVCLFESDCGEAHKNTLFLGLETPLQDGVGLK
jgi:hypothetical protein